MLFRQLTFASALFYGSTNAMGLWVRDVNGKWVRPSWEKRAEQGELLRLPLTNVNNKAYSTEVLMGTPAQKIQMAVSLSQNYIAVASPEEEGASGFYNPSASASHGQTADTVSFSNTAGDTIEANFVQEICNVAEFEYNAAVAITPPSQNSAIYPDECYGVLGYGVDPAPDVPANSTLLGIYLPSGLRDFEAVCGIELNRADSGVAGGIFTMGGRDETAFSGDFTVVNVPGADVVRNRPSWTIPVEDISAVVSNGSPSGNSSILTNGFASIDPYYPFITIPMLAANLLYSQIEGAAEAPQDSQVTGLSGGNTRFTVPCDSEVDLALTFGGKKFPVSLQDFISKEGDVCYGAIEANEDEVYRIGSPFMRNVYTTFGAIFDAEGVPTFNVAFADKVARSPSPDGSGSGSGSSSSDTSTSTLPVSSSPSSGGRLLVNPSTSLISLLLAAIVFLFL